MRPRQSQGKAKAPTPIQVIEDRMPQSRKEKDSLWAVGVEIFAWNLCMLFYGFLYNPIGELAAARNVDYSIYICTEWDSMVPVVPFMVVPYFLVYFIPGVYTMGTLWSQGILRSLGPVRRYFFTQILVMTICYILYIVFPTSIESISMRDQPPIISTLIDSNGEGVGGIMATLADHFALMNYRFVHQHMTLYCACPSMHVSLTLCMAFVHYKESVVGWTWAVLGAIVTFFSTVLTRAHYILDVPFGMMVACLMYQCIYLPLRSLNLQNIKGLLSKNTHLAMCAIFPALILIVNEYLSNIAGMRTDFIRMMFFLAPDDN